MAIELDDISSPISENEPCGPDLDLEDDPDYMNFIARVAGVLPHSETGWEGSFTWFEQERREGRLEIDLKAEAKTAQKLLERSRDLRLLALLAKLRVLDRDLIEFASSIAAIAALLERQWQHVHPAVAGGKADARAVVIEALGEWPSVVLPLQHIPLVRGNRSGPISYWIYLIALGEAKAPQGEALPDRHAIDRLSDVKFEPQLKLDDLVATRDQLKGLKESLGAIRATWMAQTGQNLDLNRLPLVLDKMLAFVEGIIVKRDPSAATPPRDAGKGMSAFGKVRDFIGEVVSKHASGRSDLAAVGVNGSAPAQESGDARSDGQATVSSAAGAAAALSAAGEYFTRAEPSSPALLLVRQAQQLMGKSLSEVIRILMPAQAEQATIQVGKDQSFELPIERLSALLPNALAGGAEQTESRTHDPVDVDGEAGPKFEARNRAEAMALLYHVGEYYRTAEPSSPIPLLTERALGLAERDFLGLLRDLLPEPSAKLVDTPPE